MSVVPLLSSKSFLRVSAVPTTLSSLLLYTVNVRPSTSAADTGPPTVFVNVMYAGVGVGAVYLLFTSTVSVSPSEIFLSVSSL